MNKALSQTFEVGVHRSFSYNKLPEEEEKPDFIWVKARTISFLNPENPEQLDKMEGK